MFTLFLSFFSKFFFDILRDKNTRKYSTTKTIALGTAIYLFGAFTVGIIISYRKQEVDHWLIGEMIALLLTLLGFKNLKSGDTQNGIDVPADPAQAIAAGLAQQKPKDQEGVF